MRKFVLVLFLTILVFQTLGQQPTKAVKISDFDDRFESISNFKEKTKILMRKLLESPSGTKAFIAIRTIRYYTDLRLRETAQAVLAQYPQTAGRVEIFRSGYTYFPRFENTELWLVPPGTESPYKGAIVDRVRCPSIELFGKEVVNNTDESLIFTANVNADVSFLWSVKGGKIIEGKNTPSITVKTKNSRVLRVSAFDRVFH